MLHVKSERDGYDFGSFARANEAAEAWNMEYSDADTMAFPQKVGSYWLVSIEVCEKGSWIIAEFLSTERELWGQLRLPLTA